MIRKLFGSLLDRHMLENAIASAAKNAADIDYMAMMAGIELDEDSDEMEVESDVEEV